MLFERFSKVIMSAITCHLKWQVKAVVTIRRFKGLTTFPCGLNRSIKLPLGVNNPDGWIITF